MGFFSPDGLIRDEQANSQASFLANTGPPKRAVSEQFVALWSAGGAYQSHQALYYPICGYVVTTVPQRQTELVQQRSLQLVQAVKLLLQESSPRNPIGTPLTADEVENRLVVVWAGGSNGGLQSSFAAMLYPDLVHGCFSQTYSPSTQRLIGEQEFGYAVAALTGSSSIGADFDPIDMRNWCHYAWNRGLDVQDLSVSRQFLSGRTYRPFYFYVGDEDLTSTGTDWIRVMTGTQFADHGEVPSPATLWSSTNNTFAWSSAEYACHDSGVATNPYNPSVSSIHTTDYALDLFARAVMNRQAQQQASAQIPQPVVVRAGRTAAQEMRGLDDPSEWFHGRPGEALPTPVVGPLTRDINWQPTGQYSAAGTWLGNKESMLIHNQKVYVGSAEGLVSCFQVDTSSADLPLVRVAQSPPLGQQAWGLTVVGSGSTASIVAGTRRHLWKLDPGMLQIQASVQLPWEVAKPYRLKVADVLPNGTGAEIIFASVHGGLVFCDQNLNLLYEWPEPGILDFTVQGDVVTIMSERGVLAGVRFTVGTGTNPYQAWLHAASEPMSGTPWDLEKVTLAFGSTLVPFTVGLWSGDADRLSLRVFWLMAGVRQWKPAGDITSVGSGFQSPTHVMVTQQGVTGITTFPWQPNEDDIKDVIFEYYNPPPTSALWAKRAVSVGILSGLLALKHGGDVLRNGPDWTTYYWSNANWGNSVDGVHATGNAIDGLWFSTAPWTSPGPGQSATPRWSGSTFELIRNVDYLFPGMDLQALRIFRINNQDTILLGCPGGRVRVMVPGSMRTDDSTDHTRATYLQGLPVDLGHGMAAFDAQVDAQGVATIWFGTACGHAARPVGYTTNGSLGDSDVLHGAIHRVTWTPGSQGGFSNLLTVPLPPTTSHPRGAFGIVGMKVVDLLPGGNHELVVTTLAGDVFLFDSSLTSISPIVRTHVSGSAGCYNAIVVTDLDGNQQKELYVGGSAGVWKFVPSGGAP